VPALRIRVAAVLFAATALFVARPASAQNEWYYGAPGSAATRSLLSKVSGWQRPSCSDCSDGATPSIVIEKPSLRDIYVLEAVMRAWTAEAYSAANDPKAARWQGEQVRFTLENATALCGKPRDAGSGDGAVALKLWGCPPPNISFDTSLETLSLRERMRRLKEAEERLAAQRAAGVSQRAAIEQSVHEKLDLANLSSNKGLFLDAASLIVESVQELAVGWTQASPSAQLADLIRDAREALLAVKSACDAEQDYRKARKAAAVKCP
jgi:hypothetical protein